MFIEAFPCHPRPANPGKKARKNSCVFAEQAIPSTVCSPFSCWSLLNVFPVAYNDFFASTGFAGSAGAKPWATVLAKSRRLNPRPMPYAVLLHLTLYQVTGGSALAHPLQTLQVSTPPWDRIAGPLAPHPIVLRALIMCLSILCHPKLKPAHSGPIAI